MAVKCMNIFENKPALHKAVVELFADTKIEVTSDMEIRDFPPGYEIEMGSILTTGDFNVAVMGSDGIWKWEENSSSKTAFNGELVYDGTILEGYKVSVKVPSGITKIGDNAFKNLTGLENVNITEGVTLIGDYAFYGCTDLKTIKIASTVTGIGDSAFEGCTGLETVYCEPATPPSLGTDAFDGIASDCVIYVPDASYVAYATSWSDMTDYLLPAGGTVEATVTGNPISMSDAVAHNAISTILSYSPKQSGTGDPSPTNIRPIEGWTEANLGVNSETPTLTANLGGTYYGFSIDLERGVLRVTHAIYTLAGTENWAIGGVGTTGIRAIETNLLPNKKAGAGICSHFKYGTAEAQGQFDMPSTYLRFNIYGIAETKEEFNAWILENSPVQVVYQLAEPFELPLTPQTVTLLAGANTLWTEGDSVALSYLAIASQHQEPAPLLGLASFSRGISDEEEEDLDTIEEPIEEEFIENLEENPEEDIIDTPVEEETTENDER